MNERYRGAIASRSSFRDGEFPGIAAFCLFGLLLLLGVVALLGLKPWATTSLVPGVGLAPGIGVALGDAEAVVRAPSIAIADAHVAEGGAAAVAARPVAYAPARPEARAAVGVSQGRAVQSPAAMPVASPPAMTQPVAAPPQAPAPQPPSAPASPAPVIAGFGQGEPGKPGTAGVGGGEDPASCEGDEYTVTITYEVDEETGEQTPIEMLIQRFESDGSVSELKLEGDLTDYRDLIAALVAEGGCVEVVLEPAGEAPGTGVEAEDPAETLEVAGP